MQGLGGHYMEIKTGIAPVENRNRIDVLDVVRGFAIFGIFIMNLHFFSGFEYVTNEQKANLWLADWNPGFEWTHHLLFGGKFYTLFSLLFAVGFALQQARFKGSDADFKHFFIRRMWVLMGIGLFHLWVLWLGDILFQYAVLGLVLVWMRNWTGRGLMWTAVVLLVLPLIHVVYLALTDGGYVMSYMLWASQLWWGIGLPKLRPDQKLVELQQVSAVLLGDSWVDLLKFHLLGPLIRVYSISRESRMAKILFVFVIGFLIGRKLMKGGLLENKSLLQKTMIFSALAGIPLNGLYAWMKMTADKSDYILLAQELVEPLAFMSFAFLYGALLLWLFAFSGWKRVLLVLQPVGQMALTNYLVQTLFGVFLFYGVGLGWGRFMGPAMQTLVCLCIFIIQILWSHWWLKNYRFGPVEWLWRNWTYGRRFPIKRGA